MSFGAKYSIAFGLTLLVLILLFLFGTQGDKKEKQAYVWERDWEIIDYFPAADAEGKEARLRFIRKGGLYKDSFSFISHEGGVPDGPKVKRRGSGMIKNIFQDWSRLRLNAYYDALDDKKIKELGITSDSAKLHLYKSKSSSPVIVTLGKKSKSGSLIIATNLEQHKGSVFMIPYHFSGKFKRPHASFREKRMLIFPPNSHTTEISVKYGKETIRVIQNKTKKKGKPVSEWSDGSGKKLVQNLVSPLNSYCRRLQILYFNDEKSVKEFGNTKELWKSAPGPEAIIKLKISDGTETKIRLKKPADALTVGKKTLVLMQSDADPFIDYADGTILRSILDQIEKIRAGPKKKSKKEILKNIKQRMKKRKPPFPHNKKKPPKRKK